MKRIGIWALALFFLILPWGAAAEEVQESVAFNGGFEELDENAFPYDWENDAWLTTEGYTYVESSTDAYSGLYAAKIESLMENDARIQQNVQVSPGQLYKLSVMVKAQDVQGGYASISFADNFDRSRTLGNTGGEWRPLECYARAGDGQDVATVRLRLGFYGENTTGIALFDDFIMVPAGESEVPDGMEILSMEPDPSFGSGGGEEEEEGAAQSQPGREIALQMLLSIVFVLLVIYAYYHIPLLRMEDKGFKFCLIAVFAYSLLMRLFLSYTQPGYDVDINCFLSWGDRMAAKGPLGFYTDINEYFCDYPPLYMLVLGALSGIRQFFGLSGSEGISQLMLRLIPTLCDLGLSFALYRAARKNIGERLAVLLASVYALLPVMMASSAAWGQIDPVLLLLMFLAIERVLERKYISGLTLFFLGLLVKPQALMLAPLGLVKLLADHFSEPDYRQRQKNRRGMQVGLFIGIGMFVLTSIVFMNGQGIFWLVERYASTLSSYPNIVLNSYNLYTMIGMNWVALTPAMDIVGYVVIALIALFGGYSYFASRRRMRGAYQAAEDARNLFLCCAAVIGGLFCFGVKMHERYILTAITMLFAAFAHKKDRRILFLALLFSSTSFLNVMRVLYYKHLPMGVEAFTAIMSAINVLGTIYLLYIVYCECLRGEKAAIKPEKPLMSSPYVPDYMRPAAYTLNMRRKEAFFLVGLTALYAVLAFTNLGDMTAPVANPETEWRSSNQYEVVAIDLGEVRNVQKIYYYGGIGPGRFGVQISPDGIHWDYVGVAEYPLNEMFRWHVYHTMSDKGNSDVDQNDEAALEEKWRQINDFEELVGQEISSYDAAWTNTIPPGDQYSISREYASEARFIRLVFTTPGVSLFEIAVGDNDGNIYPISHITSAGYADGREYDVAKLVNEPETVPETISQLNGTYFDEVYHARTAYEHIHGLSTYETTHPPLGKLIISLGIRIFGMTAFGWRFMGALFGVLMVPLMYLFAKQVFRRRDIAMLLTLLFTFDFMHFTQTRISTIDTYGVFFIMAMYFFMFRYAKMNFFREGLAKTLPTLGLCGLMFGLGAASKWIDLYAGAGLAVIFFAIMLQRAKEYSYAKRRIFAAEDADAPELRAHRKVVRLFPKYIAITLLFCVLVFILIPGVIYYCSYIPYFAYSGGITVEKVLDAQSGMFNYHNGLTTDNHPYRSSWWEWPVIARPIWYYAGRFMPEGMTATIAALGNPAVWWTGLAAVIYVVLRKVRGKDRLRSADGAQPPASLFWVVAIGLIAQYAPWILVQRSTFIYHYFATVPFLLLFIGYALEQREQTHPGIWRKARVAATLAVVLFALYYPVMSGLPMPTWYMGWLNILPRWYLFAGANNAFPWMQMWTGIGTALGVV